MNYSPYIFLPICDVLLASYKDNKYTLTKKNSEQKDFTVEFLNLKLCGIIVENSQNSFILDDGSGQITVYFSSEIEYTPQIGEYIIVFGTYTFDEETLTHKFIMKFMNSSLQPIKEIQFLLELSAFARNPDAFNSFQKPKGLEHLEMQQNQLIKYSDDIRSALEESGEDGIPIEKAKSICGSEEMYLKVLDNLSEDAYIANDRLFAI